MSMPNSSMEALRAIEFAKYNETVMAPLSLLLVLIAVAAVLVLPRPYAIAPLLVVACMIHYEQRIVILGLDFDLRRIMTIFALLRVCIRSELQTLTLNKLDKTVLALTAVMAIVPAIQSEVVWALGFLVDNALGYIVLKALLQDEDSPGVVACCLALLSIPVAAGMLTEVSSLTNPFSNFGAHESVVIREGEPRASAAFDHPILAGTFGGVVFPFAFILWSRGGWRRSLALIAIATSFIIVLTSHSSGPLYGLIGAALGLALWPARTHVQRLRNGLWIALIVLQLFMKAPVYSLIFRIPDMFSFVTGSTSYHRFMVIDTAVQNIGEWWLLGTSSDIVSTWGYGAQDSTNQFVAVGLSSGLLGVVLLILALVRGFSLTGICAQAASASALVQKSAWALGSLLFMHLFSFLGVSYFSGFWLFLNLTFALISSHCAPYVAAPQRSDLPQAESLETAHEPSSGAYVMCSPQPRHEDRHTFNPRNSDFTT